MIIYFSFSLFCCCSWLFVVAVANSSDFSHINVSQGIVATQLRCGAVVIANFPQSVPVKEFLKSVNISRRYGQKYGGMFFF